MQNVCLLESGINRHVSNGMLLAPKKIVDGKPLPNKLGYYAEGDKGFKPCSKTYVESDYPMVRAFYKDGGINRDYVLIDKENRQGLYGKEQAGKRMEDLKKSILDNGLFLRLIDDVLPKKKLDD